jgi:deazaflavin-dependent oxidoreductase (nitroreductase family)
MTAQPLHDDLARYRTIELTTTGRRSGRPTRIEIWWFEVDGRFIITGTPGRRDWLANIKANPDVIIHSPLGDHPARATTVDDPAFRRRVFTDPEIGWYRTQVELDRLVAQAPMIELDLH